MREPRFVFVSSPYQNAFFGELTEALVDALSEHGVVAIATSEPGDHEVGDDDVFVLLPPHEYVALEGTEFVTDATLAARTIGISAEQPHQAFFAGNAGVAASLGAVFDFSPLAVEAYRTIGIDAVHQPFGYVPRWDMVARASQVPRDIEVLYLGNKRPRRLEELAGAADALVRHHAVLRISDNDEPNRTSSPTFLTGQDKLSVLARTRLLVNIHQSDEPYFEWLRFAEAAHCGTAVLTETSVASEPFVDGDHYLSFRHGDLESKLDAAFDDPSQLMQVADAAYAELRSRPLAALVEPLVDAARSLLVSAPPRRLPDRTRRAPIGRDRIDPQASSTWRARRWPTVRRVLGGGRPGTVVIAPPGTIFREPLGLSDGAMMATCVVDGLGHDGVRTLEGIWPWEPWRLRHGQHLGRVMSLTSELQRAIDRWIAEPWVDEHPHVAAQLFAAHHGVVPIHVPRPVATLHGWPADPGQELPVQVAERCRQILGDRP